MGLSFDIKVNVSGQGGFQISRDKLLAQIEREKAKPASPGRDEVLKQLESLLESMS